jgi:hypothetical protein
MLFISDANTLLVLNKLTDGDLNSEDMIIMSLRFEKFLPIWLSGLFSYGTEVVKNDYSDMIARVFIWRFITLYAALTAVEPQPGHDLSLCSLPQFIHKNLMGL